MYKRQVYLKHNGSLASYGTSMEECFGDTGDIDAVRKRVRIISTWNGKKVYLEEFYNILKTAIEETELLIQKKDRELFEDILSQTISQQLTDRIAESRKWAKDMSKLMQEIDTLSLIHICTIHEICHRRRSQRIGFPVFSEGIR